MATRKSSSKPKLAAVNSLAAVRDHVAFSGEVYTIQGLTEGAYALLQRWYEEHGGDEDSLPVLHAMRLVEIVSERLDRLAEGKSEAPREVANG